MDDEKFVPAELTEIEMSPKELEIKIKLLVEDDIPLLNNLLSKIRFNRGHQAGYLVSKTGEILFYVSSDVQLDKFKEVVDDLKRMREDLSRKLKMLLRQGGYLNKYQFDPDNIIEFKRQEFTTF